MEGPTHSLSGRNRQTIGLIEEYDEQQTNFQTDTILNVTSICLRQLI
jgi:hypothetical protein